MWPNVSPLRGLLLLVWIQTFLVSLACAESTEPTLDAFWARSLIWLRSSKQTPDELVEPYELLEIYDQARQLAKLVLTMPEGVQVELYARARDPLYLERLISPDGSLQSCTIFTRPKLHESFRQIAFVVANETLGIGQHLLGPSGNLYLFRAKLLQAYKRRQIFSKNSSMALDGTRPDQSARLTVQECLKSDSGLELQFEQFLEPQLSVWPLIGQLAAGFSYQTIYGQRLKLEYLALEELVHGWDSGTDPFRLPTGSLACSSPEEPEDFRSGQPSQLARRLLANLSPASLSLAWPELSPGQQPRRLTLDLNQNRLIVQVPGHSSSLIDLVRGLIYHQDSERSLTAGPQQQQHKLGPQSRLGSRNEHCSILHWPESLSESGQSICVGKRWRFLAGNASSALYLGRNPDSPNSGWVHEFELSYVETNHLPLFMRTLLPRGWLHNASRMMNEPSAAGNQIKLLARLWISASSDTCANLYLSQYGAPSTDPSTDCDAPEPVGYQVELVDTSKGLIVPLSFYRIQFLEFQHEHRFSLEDRFDLSKCPLEKLSLYFDVTWVGQLPEGFDLDDQVDNKLMELLDDHTDSNLWILALSRHGKHLAGTRHIRYLLELGQPPHEALEFQLEAQQISLPSTQALAQFLGSVFSLFECLTWASQFSELETLLYSHVNFNCLVYQLPVSKFQSAGSGSGIPYDLYSPIVYRDANEESRHKVSGTPIGLFLSEQMDAINSDIRRSNKAISQTEEPQIFLSQLRMAKESTSRFSSHSELPYLRGHRFIDGKADGAHSLIECRFSCDQNPRCASISFCAQPAPGERHHCQLSYFRHDQNYSALVRNPDCNIYSRDYLQLYESPKPTASLGQASLLYQTKIGPVSALECAQLCYTEATSQPSSCESFIHCAVDGRCYHSSSNHESSPMIQDQQLEACQVYRLKESSFYRPVISVKNAELLWSGSSDLIVTKLEQPISMDGCARKCNQLYECQSFDWCQVQLSPSEHSYLNARPTFLRSECTLLTGSIFGVDKMEFEYKELDIKSVNLEISEDATLSLVGRDCSHYEQSVWTDGDPEPKDDQLKQHIERIAISKGQLDSWHPVGFVMLAPLLGVLFGLLFDFLLTRWRTAQKLALSAT